MLWLTKRLNWRTVSIISRSDEEKTRLRPILLVSSECRILKIVLIYMPKYHAASRMCWCLKHRSAPGICWYQHRYPFGEPVHSDYPNSGLSISLRSRLHGFDKPYSLISAWKEYETRVHTTAMPITRYILQSHCFSIFIIIQTAPFNSKKSGLDGGSKELFLISSTTIFCVVLLLCPHPGTVALCPVWSAPSLVSRVCHTAILLILWIYLCADNIAVKNRRKSESEKAVNNAVNLTLRDNSSILAKPDIASTDLVQWIWI